MSRLRNTVISISLLSALVTSAGNHPVRTRGIGIYPGSQKENYSAIERRGLEGNRYYLNGNQWRMNGLQHTYPEGEELSSSHFDDSNWMKAYVPSTNFMNFVNSGLYPEPNYSDNILKVDQERFADDFWYRTQFELPEGFLDPNNSLWLNFDGINWKAHVFINGKRVGKIAGAFKHSRFNISDYLVPGTNTLAVKVISNAHPGAIHERTAKSTGRNGGVLGADNPTFHASVGWDWIPTIPGRNAGIWNNVYLSAEGPVKLDFPEVKTKLNLPDTIPSITPSIELTNSTSGKIDGMLKVSIGHLSAEQTVSIPAGESITESFSPERFPIFNSTDLSLWWPNGLGMPNLHKAQFIFTPDNGMRADTLTFDAGIRQIDVTDPDSNLKIYVNGKRFAPLGGNWGFPEANLRYGKREYDIALDMHRRMNFTTIRNWVGQTGHEEFYDACDRNGVMIWQDFWLANPGDGPNPDDEEMFLDNGRQMIKRIRRHPALLLYCGRNEGNPPAFLNKELKASVDSLHSGMLYIPHSAANGVSGFGPYNARPPHEYFENQSGKTHSERGMPAPLTFEGLKRTMPETEMYPLLSKSMGQHDFTSKGAQGGESFIALMEKSFGEISNPRQFCELAQWISYDGYRAMFEATSKNRQGLLLWMSHSAWPSMVWQTYDYYFEPLGAFFGARKGCEPLHVQHNPVANTTEIVNRSGKSHNRMTATTNLLDINGKRIASDRETTNIPVDATLTFPIPSLPEGYEGTYFIEQQLSDSKGKIASSNFYVKSTDPYVFTDLNKLPPAQVHMKVSGIKEAGSKRTMTAKLKNTSGTPAMLLRLNLLDGDGEQILPVFYSDNYIHLMPGKSIDVAVEWDIADTRSDSTPTLSLSGFNLQEK